MQCGFQYEAYYYYSTSTVKSHRKILGSLCDWSLGLAMAVQITKKRKVSTISLSKRLALKLEWVFFSLLLMGFSRPNWTIFWWESWPRMDIPVLRWLTAYTRVVSEWNRIVSGAKNSCPYRSDHHGHSNPECFGRERASYSRVDVARSEAFRLQWGYRWGTTDFAIV